MGVDRNGSEVSGKVRLFLNNVNKVRTYMVRKGRVLYGKDWQGFVYPRFK